MKIRQYHIYWADLGAGFGSEPGKIRPVVAVQSNVLNVDHYSTVVCPITSDVKSGFAILRVHLPKIESGLNKDSDILVDQIRTIDNRRFIKEAGRISLSHLKKLKRGLKIILFE